jgi:hypothetical protein
MPPLLADARARGNLYFETELRTRMNLVVGRDRPTKGTGGERGDGALGTGWIPAPALNHALARIQTELYRAGREAWRIIDRTGRR